MTDGALSTSTANVGAQPQPPPILPIKDSWRKVPGGFDADDADDLSPSKAAHEHVDWGHNGEARPSNSNDRPALNMKSLPPLPAGDSSMLHSSSDFDGTSDQIDEHAMRRHLNDMESSFLPALSPLDDTQGEEDSSEQLPRAHGQSQSPGVVPNTTRSEMNDSPDSDSQPFQTPYLTRRHTPDEDSNAANTTASLETLSSPTAAAAARTITRTMAAATLSSSEEVADKSDSEPSTRDTETEEESTPKRQRHRLLGNTASDEESSTLREQASSNSLRAAYQDAGRTPGGALTNRNSSRNRPKFLRSRNGSTRSSISSFLTNGSSDGQSERNTATDYALQTGGALPAEGLSRGNSYNLSRQVSLGSMASEFDEQLSISDGPERILATLEEERNQSRPSTAIKHEDSASPATPRGPSHSLNAPTDTVIARKVQDVHVPESVALEYRNNHRSPSKTSNYTATVGRNGKNLTLKEQSNTIERLSKENFDLKLKVMFLSDRLDKVSEEGVKETISENVELKTALANFQRDNKALRKKNKDLEQKLRDEEQRPSTAASGASSNGERGLKFFDQEDAEEREEELVYLRERVEEYVVEIEKLKKEALNREVEKRKMAETVHAMGQTRGDNFEAREEMDVWRDLLEQESARREQAEEDSRKLREEMSKIKTEISLSGGIPGLNHTTNIYNITKKRASSPTRPRSELSERMDDRNNGTFSAASTRVEDLRRESEQLRHENAELRREVGAQTSMLTSRNKEKERLYQEIEDLKIQTRRIGGSVAGDSILERSASRAHERSLSRNSVVTRLNGMEEAERDEYEAQAAELRDKITELRLKLQEYQQEMDTIELEFHGHLDEKEAMEQALVEMEERLDQQEADIQTMQAERDEALRGQEQTEYEFESLKAEAQEELDNRDAERERLNHELEKLEAELADKTENFAALQGEMRAMSDGLIRLEDEQDAKMRRIQELEREVEQNNQEFEEISAHLKEANEKVERLQVQQESSQGEIEFLREEQEGDKVKIGELESSLKSAEKSLQDEIAHVQELEQQQENEREQWNAVQGKNKEQVHQIINNLNREVQAAKDDARISHKRAQAEERESAAWKARLQELENNLGAALGTLNGTRASLLTSVEKLQREMESTSRELEETRNKLNHKDRLLEQRDELMESHGLETRKIVDLLDAERQSHRNTKHQFDTFQKQHQHTSRTVSQQDARMQELEQSRALDRKKMTTLENSFKDQLTERNNLLLQLWNRLSGLCGLDWAHNNSLINGRALPTLEAVATMLPGFSKNLFNAIKHIDSIVGSFKTQVKAVERDMMKEYQQLELTLDSRTKRLDRLELIIKSSGVGGASTSSALSLGAKAEIAKYRDANRILKAELANLRNVDNRTRNLADNLGAPSPSPVVFSGPRHKSSMNNMKESRGSPVPTTLTRHHSAGAVETLERAQTSSGIPVSNNSKDLMRSASSAAGGGSNSGSNGGGGGEAEQGEQRWIFRLRELERRLKAEREARLLDRTGARKRLEEGARREDELRQELDRRRVREEGR